jgi:hypothetical protein
MTVVVSLMSSSSRTAGEWSEGSTRLAWCTEDDEESEEVEEAGEVSIGDMVVVERENAEVAPQGKYG